MVVVAVVVVVCANVCVIAVHCGGSFAMAHMGRPEDNFVVLTLFTDLKVHPRGPA